MRRSVAWRRTLAVLGVIVGANVLGQVVACAALQEAFLGPSAPVVNPIDDAVLWGCRTQAQAELATRHDRLSACHIYDACVIDAGMRGDIGFCNGIEAGAPAADAGSDQ